MSELDEARKRCWRYANFASPAIDPGTVRLILESEAELAAVRQELARAQETGALLAADLVEAEGERDRLREALQRIDKLPTRWRCLSLDSPEDAPALWGGILTACADELDAARAALEPAVPEYQSVRKRLRVQMGREPNEQEVLAARGDVLVPAVCARTNEKCQQRCAQCNGCIAHDLCGHGWNH